MPSLQTIATIVFIGTGATVIMDVWLMFLKLVGVPTGSFALIGRWVGHFARGKFAHAAIAKSKPIHGELALGWLTHYATGVAYAALLFAFVGVRWIEQPTVLPAFIFGLATVAAPFLVMQPAMGSGLAASKTAAPAANRLRSLANHSVFGLGLYFSAIAIAWASR